MLEDMPSKDTLLRMVIRLDIATMLRHRAWYSSCRTAFRYVAYDASPQHGTELFGTVERIVLASDIMEQLEKDLPEVTVLQRKLPVCQLGQCRLGAAEKATTLLHQTWLEYGAKHS